MNKFYIFLGSKFGSICSNKKKFKSDVETFFAEESIQIKQIDVRQTHGNRYHAFVTLFFSSNEKLVEFISSIQSSSVKYRVINHTWKIYQYLSKKDRKVELNTAFCEDSCDEEVVLGDNVLDEEEEGGAWEEAQEEAREEEEQEAGEEAELIKQDDKEISFIEYEEPVYQYEYNEYESIYTWLVTPQLHELKKAEEMKEICRWLSTSFWQRT